jgi:competence protein ComEC
MRDPLLIPALGFGIGLIVQMGIPGSGVQAGVWALVGTLMLLVGRNSRRPLRLILSGVVSVAGGIGYLHWRMDASPMILETGPDGYALFEACVVEPPQLAPDRASMIVEIGPEARARLSIRIRPGEPVPVFRYGQRVEFVARARTPRRFENPGSFDYPDYLARRDIFWLFSARPEEVKVLGGRCGHPVWHTLYGWRAGLAGRIDRVFPEHSAMARALLIGDSAALDRQVTDAYRQTASYHALVISGMHLSLIATALLALLRWLPVRPWLRILPVLALVWIYTGINGMAIPLERAAVALTLLLPVRMLYRKARPINLLAAAWLGFLIWDPQLLRDGSFQLTFAAVAALILVAAPAVETWIHPWGTALRRLGDPDAGMKMERRTAAIRTELRLVAETAWLAAGIPFQTCCQLLTWMRPLTWLVAAVLTATAMQLALFPIQATMFHQFPVTGLAASVAVVGILTAAVPALLVAVALPIPLLRGLGQGMLEVAQGMAETLAALEPMPRVPNLPWIVLGLATLAILLAAWSVRSGRWRATGVVVCLTLAFPFACSRPAAQQRMEMAVLDVGQGDSILLTMPDGQRVLVDGGGIPVFKGMPKPRIDIGEDVVSPYLWSQGIGRVDILVSTHQHDDHLQGLLAITRNFRPREIWTGALSRTETWQQLEPVLQRRGTAVRELRTGFEQRFGHARIRVAWPPPDYEKKDDATNNDSLILLAELGERRFLLTGDAEGVAESRLVEDRLPRIDVLKVAHHGSKTSTSDEFLDQARPTFAILSLGRDNLYRFPHPGVLERLRQRRVMTLRTDQKGLIRISTDGRDLELATHRP